MGVSFVSSRAFASLILLLLVMVIGGNFRVMGGKLQMKTAGGDIIDCVNIYEQPALKHPSMKNHTIQMRPSQLPNFGKQMASPLLLEGESCPEGTIPILRAKNESEMYVNFAGNDDVKIEYAVAESNGGPLTGVSGDIVVWKMHVEPNEYSFNMVACEALDDGDRLKKILFAGWGVFPSIYDDKSRIFIGLRRRGREGCINAACEGFVQVSNNLPLGGSFQDSSVYGDRSHQITISVAIYLDENLDRWWVSFAGQPVGYFPGEIVTNLVCSGVIWGGMVIIRGTNPTPTQMGNGHFTNEGFAKTGAIAHGLFKNGSRLVFDEPSGYSVTRPSCFDVKYLGVMDDLPGIVLLYGGPGSGSSTCA